jgi:hypothetical protein
MGLFNDIDPIFFYHKSVKPLLAMGFNGVVTPSDNSSPLPSEIRAFMEPRFGVDFSAIEVHTDSAAAQMCKEVGAKAFAVGNRIYSTSGCYEVQ